MESTKTLLLNKQQIEQKINRLAWQVYEDSADEKEIVIAGIVKSGMLVAGLLADALKNISPVKIIVAAVHIDKRSQVDHEIKISVSKEELQGKVIILVDDVLNSGKTLMYSLRPFLNADIKKIRTVVLVDRNHKRYPISADYVGFPLATTLQEHVSVELENENESVFLS